MTAPAPEPSPGADSSRFRHAARRFASGVTVVTTALEDGNVYGVTATSFASLSISPLLVTVSLHHQSRMLTYARQSGCFAVSVLRGDQRAVSQYFAARGREPERGFPGIECSRAVTGAPLISDSLAYFDCDLHDMLPGGDHRILVGNVVAAGGAGGEPLLYYDGDYRRLHGGEPGPGEAAPDEPDHESDSRGQAAERLSDGVAVQLHLARLTLSEIVTAQAAIEPSAAQLAAENATSQDIRRLTGLLEAAGEAVDDRDRFTELGTQFHVEVARASGNPLLAATMQALRVEQRLVYAPRNDREKALRSHHFHGRLLEKIAAGDGAGARAVMTEHVSLVASRVGEPAGRLLRPAARTH